LKDTKTERLDVEALIITYKSVFSRMDVLLSKGQLLAIGRLSVIGSNSDDVGGKEEE
jgi:hypothetical protein